MIYEYDGRCPQIDSSTFVSDSAVIIGDVEIGADCYIGPNAVIRGDAAKIVIGDATAIEDGVLIHAGGLKRMVIGSRVTIGHGAIVHSKFLANNSNVGMGAVLSLFSEIGEYAVVGEGALVKKGQIIKPKTVVGGVPAIELRQLEQKDIAFWDASKDIYINLARACNKGVLKRID